MMNEDYVSFETAKLLKEKGFDEPVTELNKLFFKEGEKPVLKITLQKAMKWLREVHNVMISPYALSLGWYFEIFDLTERDVTGSKPIYKVGIPDKANVMGTYEQACDAAIRYYIENIMQYNW